MENVTDTQQSTWGGRPVLLAVASVAFKEVLRPHTRPRAAAFLLFALAHVPFPRPPLRRQLLLLPAFLRLIRKLFVPYYPSSSTDLSPMSPFSPPTPNLPTSSPSAEEKVCFSVPKVCVCVFPAARLARQSVSRRDLMRGEGDPLGDPGFSSAGLQLSVRDFVLSFHSFTGSGCLANS